MIEKSFVRHGLRLAWYDAGGDGLPVVFQHGLGGDMRQTLEAFPRDDRYRLITLECRGHGASEAGPFSIAAFSDDLAALIEAQQLGSVVLGGISMGAAIATRLAVKRPDLVHGLLLIRPAWVAETAPANVQPNSEVGALLAALPADEARAVFSQSATYRNLRDAGPDNLVSLLGFFAREPVTTTATLLQAIAADGPGVSVSELAALTVPTLVVGTERDFIHPWAMAERLAGVIPNAQLRQATPKSIDKQAYLADVHNAIGAFLEDF